MPRSTDTQKARRLNAAYGLLGRGLSVAEATMSLSGEFAISRRQAYRYIQRARTLNAPLPVAEPAVAVTVKLPGAVARQLRALAASSGLTQGEIIGRALAAFTGPAGDRA